MILGLTLGDKVNHWFIEYYWLCLAPAMFYIDDSSTCLHVREQALHPRVLNNVAHLGVNMLSTSASAALGQTAEVVSEESKRELEAINLLPVPGTHEGNVFIHSSSTAVTDDSLTYRTSLRKAMLNLAWD